MRPEVVETAAAQGVTPDRSAWTPASAPRRWWPRGNELGIDVIVTDHHLPDSRPAARGGRAESQSARLPVPRQESLRRGRGVQTGAGTAGHAGLAGKPSCGA